MIDLYIIGTNHDLQRELPFHNTQNTSLRDKISGIIQARSVVLIAEEVNANEQHQQIIHGRKLGMDHSPAIPWLSLDLTTTQLQNAGIDSDLWAAASLTECAAKAHRKEIYHPVQANNFREVCWLEKIRAVCDVLNLASGTVLVTCGRVHLEPLAKKAEQCGWNAIATEFPEGLGAAIGEIKYLR